MPDKWSQYAVLPPGPAPAKSAAPADKWAQYATPSATPAPGAPTGGDLRPTSFEDQLTEIRPDNPNDSLLSRGANFVGNIGAAGMGTLLHPVNTAKGVANSILHPADTFKSTFDALNTRPADTTASLIGQSAAMAPVAELAPRIAAPVMEKLGSSAADAAAGGMNKIIGSRKADYAHGANPGRAYLTAGGKPAMSMSGLAENASALQDEVGGKLGDLYANATNSGVKIPVNNVTSALRAPMQDARSVITGPGGTGDVQPIRQFGASFSPPIQKAVANGGFDPSDLWAAKRNVAKNTSWTDPTQVGMKSLRQQTTGSLSGVLSDAIPETKPLNSQYQGLENMAARTGERALTNSMPLTSLFGKAAAGTGGALIGATHSPLTAAAGAIVGSALDSIPVKSTAAYGLYRGARAATAIGSKLRSLY